jgi:hypothetical protein
MFSGFLTKMLYARLICDTRRKIFFDLLSHLTTLADRAVINSTNPSQIKKITHGVKLKSLNSLQLQLIALGIRISSQNPSFLLKIRKAVASPKIIQQGHSYFHSALLSTETLATKYLQEQKKKKRDLQPVLITIIENEW